MSDHDADGQSPRTITGDSSLGFSRVRTRQEQRPHTRATDHGNGRDQNVRQGSAQYQAGTPAKASLQRWHWVVFVLTVLFSLAIATETVARAVVNADVLAVGSETPWFLQQIHSAFQTAVWRARYLTVAVSGFTVVAGGLGALHLLLRSRF